MGVSVGRCLGNVGRDVGRGVSVSVRRGHGNVGRYVGRSVGVSVRRGLKKTLRGTSVGAWAYVLAEALEITSVGAWE